MYARSFFSVFLFLLFVFRHFPFCILSQFDSFFRLKIAFTHRNFFGLKNKLRRFVFVQQINLTDDGSCAGTYLHLFSHQILPIVRSYHENSKKKTHFHLIQRKKNNFFSSRFLSIYSSRRTTLCQCTIRSLQWLRCIR